MQLFGHTNIENTNALPKLSPPYGEWPPTFWEQHGTKVILAGIAAVALVAFMLWLVFRPKPKIITPPEVRARKALQELQTQPEDGTVLSLISQIIRQYFIAAFELPPGELTTTEFCREISGKENPGTELSAAVVNFLRDCDARKFSSTAASVKLDAVNRALTLLEQAEQQRAQFRQTVETQARGGSV